jgi:predicted nucleic acid-binding protein
MGAELDEVLLLDTSAAVALVVEDHELHAVTLEAVQGHRLGLAGHAWFETYSVLTRLPGGLRRSPADIAALLAHDFPATAFLTAKAAAALGSELAGLGVSGGAVYDALVGAAARQQGRSLVTGDARARSVYEALGVRVRLTPGG